MGEDQSMRYGFITPGQPLDNIIEAGVAAEEAGWDGFFYYDHDSGPDASDPWVALAAVALRTQRVKLGAVLVPLPWRRPWLVARALTTLDHLSRGRMILPIGLGAVEQEDWDRGRTRLGEVVDRRHRAALMDEGLEIIDGLWRGEPLVHEGQHYRVDLPAMRTPVQRPRIPIWVVGAWGSRKSMGRAFRYDGWMPSNVEDWRAAGEYLRERRPADRPFDLVIEGRTPGDDPGTAREIIRPYVDAGATWWLETMWEAPNGTEDVLARIRQGPPRG
jgi:alkanesulfonate monooxygenase SsuD/methylene tetrahydromethanopterin reductase-like flavin-dependent oxidoreductase (luciferase family)